MLRIIPLGGLGEIGLNCMAFEHSGERMLVDCGLMFPRGNSPSVKRVPQTGTLIRLRRNGTAPM